ncbi:hypothetical protein OB236_14745 [Paenibacillus sp. WQ 127069]|uniref:Uncharacterized protein n=1 Tax=Paenibacillus baimaensis TaxID=2982185 RepID=A0ABT2UFE7_9BACL|nr:hypothetical protein [Paenibacillus sp. WQ 127069]
MRHPLLIILSFAAGLSVLSVLPDVSGKNIFVYAGYFMLGFFMATSDRIMDLIEQRRRLYLVATLIGTALLFREIYTIRKPVGLYFYSSPLASLLGNSTYDARVWQKVSEPKVNLYDLL